MKQPNTTQKIILKYKNKVLILRHLNGAYDFPGGQIEWQEGLFTSLQRELREELSFELKIQPRLFHVWNYISKDKKRHSVMIYYICKLIKKPILKVNEGLEALWFSKNELKKIIRDQDYVRRIFNWKNRKSTPSLFYCD